MPDNHAENEGFEGRSDQITRDTSTSPYAPPRQLPDGDRSSSVDDRTERVRRYLKRVFNRQLPLQDETSYFILVNVLDIVMTNILLNLGAIESNPLANYIFMRYGFKAMIAFKMLLVAFICVLAQFIARRSMPYAKFVLLGGTAIVGGVVVYSVVLGFKWF